MGPSSYLMIDKSEDTLEQVVCHIPTTTRSNKRTGNWREENCMPHDVFLEKKPAADSLRSVELEFFSS